MDNYKVYKHTFPNGKVYIGITQQTLIKRWQNGKGYKKQKFLYNAIQKYNWENVKHEVLFKNLTKEQAEQKEIELIELYKSNQRTFGYNIENGGNSIGKMADDTKTKLRKLNIGKKMSQNTKEQLLKANVGKIISEETRRKISEAQKGKKVSEATRKKLSYANKGRKVSEQTREKLRIANKGKKLSESTILKFKKRVFSQETRNKMSVSRKGKPRSEETKKKISNAQKGKIISQDTRNKISLANIGRKVSQETINKRIQKMYNICGEKIICVETGIIYNSITQASRMLKIDRHTIIRSCKNSCKSRKNIHFKYL